MKTRVFHYFVRFVEHPRRAADEIAADPRGFRAGAWWLVLYGLGYAIVALVFYLLGHRPVAQPFLPIPLARWYLFQAFYTVPVTFTSSLAYVGLAFIICRAFRGQGSYEATFASQAYTTIVPWVFFTWAPEMFLAPVFIGLGRTALPWSETVETFRQFIFPLAWVFFGSTVTLSRIHRLSWWKALLAVTAGLIPMAGILAVFIR